MENQDGASLDEQWKQWKIKFNKEYKSPDEEVKRRDIWEENKLRVEAHNREAAQGKHTYTQGLNQFSDMTEEEWSERRGLVVPEYLEHNFRNSPGSADFHKKDMGIPVKNQVPFGEP
ncbi:protein CTLA-2-alpha-like [Odontesthes bonariensis]|uniref:protein CTLA-2-alpha-like n=1 Tax=Odontesthes bonariensis TaxID=219752 RepID=UPI003F58EC3D